MSRKYIKIDEYGKQILEMKAQGKTSRESHLPPLSGESLPGEYTLPHKNDGHYWPVWCAASYHLPRTV